MGTALERLLEVLTKQEEVMGQVDRTAFVWEVVGVIAIVAILIHIFVKFRN